MQASNKASSSGGAICITGAGNAKFVLQDNAFVAENSAELGGFVSVCSGHASVFGVCLLLSGLLPTRP